MASTATAHRTGPTQRDTTTERETTAERDWGISVDPRVEPRPSPIYKIGIPGW